MAAISPALAKHLEAATEKDSRLSSTIRHQISQGLFNGAASSENLGFLGENLEPTSEQRIEAHQKIFLLTDTIQRDIGVTRFFVSGDYGRRVTIGRPHVDLVVFLRNADEIPPYTRPGGVLHRIRDSLHKHLSRNHDVAVGYIGESNETATSTFIPLHVGEMTFSIYAAPGLGRVSEEQRQATYRLMLKAWNRGGIEALEGWHPSLCEKASESMAKETAEVQAFIRVCKYWATVHQIRNIDSYAIETLAFIIARKTRKEGNARMRKRNSDSENTQSAYRFNLIEAFQRFLECLCHPMSIYNLCEIEAPASYVSPWTAAKQPILTDTFNPYRNLLDSVGEEDWSRISRLCRVTLTRLRTLPTTEEEERGRERLKTKRHQTLTLAQLFAPIDPLDNTSSKSLKGWVVWLSIIVVLLSCIYVYDIQYTHLIARYFNAIKCVTTVGEPACDANDAFMTSQFVKWVQTAHKTYRSYSRNLGQVVTGVVSSGDK